jgi:hypothetical protein
MDRLQTQINQDRRRALCALGRIWLQPMVDGEAVHRAVTIALGHERDSGGQG